jgi:integrase
MAKREHKRLDAAHLGKLKPGRYADGRGLYLRVLPNETRFWVFRYTDQAGSVREKGLGSYEVVTLKKARAQADGLRVAVHEGADPINDKRTARHAAKLAAAKLLTFAQCATAFFDAHKASWRNPKHRDQWRNTINTYCADMLPLPVAEIDTDLVLKALQPIWTDKTETATRVRQRIETVLDWATARRFRHGENPARWRGHLDKLLPKPSKVKTIEHRPALAYREIGGFFGALVARTSISALALRMQILTASRPSETAAARWDEFDLEAGAWTVPAARMKAKRDHRVPLAPGLVSMLLGLPRDRSGLVFTAKPGKPLTTASMLNLAKEIKPGITVHGFRSTFRDWAAEQTGYPREVAEAALAHVLADKTEAAYRRTDLFEKRARMMADWERHCLTSASGERNIRPLKRVAKQ